MVNTRKIKGRMAEKDMTQKDIAKILGIKPSTASQKINNVRPISLNEAEKLCEALEIEASDFGVYFFAR